MCRLFYGEEKGQGVDHLGGVGAGSICVGGYDETFVGIGVGERANGSRLRLFLL